MERTRGEVAAIDVTLIGGTGGGALSAFLLYLWRRDLLANILAHSTGLALMLAAIR